MTSSFDTEMLSLLPRLRRFALSLTRRADLADDLVQTTCEKALTNRNSWQAGTRLDAWMFRIMRNAWIDGLRRRRTEGTQLDIDEHAEIIGDTLATRPEERLLLDAVWRQIGNLPDEQREVLLLVCVEEFSYAQTAEVLGIPIGTVMSRLARARIKISENTGITEKVSR